MADPSEEELQRRVSAALDTAEVPAFYINGFVNTMTAGDIVTVLERNGKPVALVQMSFTVAKTLSIALGQTIARLEERAGQSMLTTHEVAKALQTEAKK